MLELHGKHANAKVFTDRIENGAIAQLIELLNEPFTKDSKIRIMPDCHQGAGCVIGTTMTVTDKVVPNLVGVDLGCGVLAFNLKDAVIDLPKLDIFIRENIPYGFNVHEDEQRFDHIKELRCIAHINQSRVLKSIGSLGGGNHYFECGVDDQGNTYLTIHSGSRYLGKQIAEYYQELAIKGLTDVGDQVKQLVKKLKSENRQNEIEASIKKIMPPKINKALAYLEGQNLSDYLHDIKIAQEYAYQNRYAMGLAILKHLNITEIDCFDTVHNYIDTDTRILRKGAIRANNGDIVMIPINMRDGCLLARGKGNPDWNYSAPHGAGRLFSRGQAKRNITLEAFAESMTGIYSTSVRSDTIDESPFVYKPIAEIIENTKDTIEVISIIKPIYNFKA